MLRDHDPEAGFTLVELIVAMTIMMLVTGALLGAMDSGTTAERRASDRIDAQQQTRLVLDQFSRDVRNATELTGVSASEVDLVTSAGPITWTLNGQQLSRTMGSTAGVSASGLVSGSFDAVSADGSDLMTLAGATAADLTRCTTTITATVEVGQRAPAAPFDETATAPLHSETDQRGCP